MNFLRMRERLRGSLFIFIIQSAVLLLLLERWWPTFNGLGPSIWISMLLVGAAAAAIAATRESARIEAEARPVTEVSPRSQFGIVVLHWGADVLTLSIIPTVMASSVAYLLVAAFGYGYFDWGYPLYALLFGIAMVLLGKVAARLFAGRVIAPLVAFVLAVYAWMYTIVTSAHADTWTMFDRAALLFVVLLAALLFVGLLLAYRASEKRAAAVAGLTLVGFVALVFIGGSIHVYNYPRVPTADPECVTVASDSICVWPEDEPLLPGLVAQLERAQALEAAAGIERPSIVFAEPGYDGASRGGHRMTVAPVEGGASLRSAQGFVAPAVDTHTGFPQCVDGNSTGEDFDRHFQVADLMTAYVIGDMADDSWATSSPEMDAWRLQVGQVLEEWPEADRVAWLGDQLAHYNEYCEFSGEIAQ